MSAINKGAGEHGGQWLPGELRDVSARGNKAPLHVTGELRALAEAWWKTNMRGDETLSAVTISGDGYLRFHWSEPNDFGTYRLPVLLVYSPATNPADPA